MRIVDVHNHFYPPAYLDALKRGDSSIVVKYDSDGNPEIHYPGDYNVAVAGHREIAYRQGVLEQEGVDTQILTLTTPGTHVETAAVAAKLAALTNDDFATIARERAPRFTWLATLPLNDPVASLKELRRAVEQLNAPGAMLFSNVNGVALADERYWPLYEYANDRELVLHIHPTNPVGVESMTEYWLMPLVGFLMDTTLAAGKLVFSGVAERYPKIRWVLSHLGGAVPYLVERFDRGYRAFPECRANIKKLPSEYLKTWYYDTVNFNPKAVELAIEFAGADHIMAGSDYPHAIGSIPLMKETLAALTITDAERAAIMGGTAAKLYRL